MAPDGIAAFWAWWGEAGGRIAAAIDGDGVEGPLVDEISARVDAIDDALDWELGPGLKARYLFCMSAKGDPVLRRLTERWRRAGPPADESWEFHAARPAKTLVPGGDLNLGDLTLPVDDFVVAFEVDENRELIDVTCFHPAFPDMTEDQRSSTKYLLLDGALGEDGVERWLGGIKAVTAAPAGGRPIEALGGAIDALAKAATGYRGVIMRGEEADGNPLFVSLNMALKRIDHLECDHHVTIDLALLDPTDQGLTTNEEADQLNALEDEVTPLLAGAINFGRETRGGRRVIHFFTPDDDLSRARLDRWASRLRERGVRVAWTEDPRWDARDRFFDRVSNSQQRKR